MASVGEAPNSAQESSSTAVAIQEENDKVMNKAGSYEELVEAMYSHFANYESHFSIIYVGDTSNIQQLVERASKEAAERNPFLYGHMDARQITYSYTKKSAQIDVSQVFLISKAEASTVEQTVDKIIASRQAQNFSNIEKIKFVNDFIVKQTEYSDVTNGSPHSAYTVLVERKGVCQGYALLAQKMLTKLGIPSHYVVGEAGGNAHAWNLVQLDGQWYHLDTTWNDPLPDRGKDFTSYTYFLKSEEQILKDHSYNITKYPRATSTKYGYWHNITNPYEYGNFIYFSHAKDDHQLYKMNKNTNEIVKVANMRVQYLTGAGSTLYFSNYSNGGFLFKMDLQTEQSEMLLKKHVQNLFVDDAFLYFTTDEGKMKIEL